MNRPGDLPDGRSPQAFQRRPRESADPYAAASRSGTMADALNKQWWSWITAFASQRGRETLSRSLLIATTERTHVTQRPGSSRLATSVSTLTTGSQATARL
jgi:hypothetical protein